MRKDLEDLIFLGSMRETYNLFGKKWTLRTITSDEQLKSTIATSNFDMVTRLHAVKLEVLAYSLESIDGVVLNDAVETIEFLRKLPMQVINSLFAKYDELQSKQNEALEDIEELKN